MANPVGYLGTAEATDNGSDFNANTFLVWSILARVRTMQICEVMGVTNAGGVSPVGFVSLKPMVNQLDGYGNAEPHGIIYNVPYFRLQGGANAIILDPQKGDIGWAGFADRDISSVKATKAQANPGSRRMFSMADAVYFGGILNGTPNQYIAFSASGIAVTSPTAVTITAPNITSDASENFTVNSPTITLNGNLQQGNGATTYPATLQGPITVINDVVAGGISVINHEHTSESPGTPTSPPIAGT